MRRVYRIKKVWSYDHVELEEVLNPYESRYGDTLKRWLGRQRDDRVKELSDKSHVSVRSLRTWMSSKRHDLCIEEAVATFFRGDRVCSVKKRRREDCDTLNCYYTFDCLLDNMEYEVLVENGRVCKVLHAVYVPKKQKTSIFLSFLLSDASKRRSEVYELISSINKSIRWDDLSCALDDLEHCRYRMHDNLIKTLQEHIKQGLLVRSKYIYKKETIWKKYWISKDALELMTNLSSASITYSDEQMETIQYLRNCFWTLYGSYKYQANKYMDNAIQWQWLKKNNDYVTIAFVHDAIQHIKQTLKDATFVLGDPTTLETTSQYILVKHDESAFEARCRLDNKQNHIIVTKLPNNTISSICIYRAHQFTIHDWTQMLPTLNHIKHITIMGRTDQYGHLFQHMIQHHKHIQKPLSICCKYKYINDCKDIRDFFIKPSMTCQYMASQTIHTTLTPQRIWLYYPKRLRTINERIGRQCTFEEFDREPKTNIKNIHDASIIAVKDYIGPTLATIIMIVDQHTKPFDIYTVRTLAYHKVYYILQGNYSAGEQNTPPKQHIIY